jgi:DNA-directed RNA polymerase subunit RPC12/RpoP
MPETMIKCRKCGKKVPLSNMSHDKQNNLVCLNCLVSGGPIGRNVPRERPIQSPPRNSQKFKCNACGYVFYRVNDAQSLRCPYCSKSDVSPYNSGADQLLKDVDDFEKQKFFKEDE